MLERGDMGGCAVWKRALKAVEELQRSLGRRFIEARLSAALVPGGGVREPPPIPVRLLYFLLDAVGDFRCSGIVALFDTSSLVVRCTSGKKRERDYRYECGRDWSHRGHLTRQCDTLKFKAAMRCAIKTIHMPVRPEFA